MNEPTRSEERPVQGVLVAHGAMAEGLVDAVRKISGVDGALTPLTNEGRSPETLLTDLNEVLEPGPAIIFADLASGSCGLAALTCCRDGGDQVALFGVNLPVLLDFVFHRHLPLEELVPRLLERGRKSLRSAPEFPAYVHRPL